MASPRTLRARRSIPVPVDEAYETVLALPLTRLFSRRYAALPPIVEVRDQTGLWGTVGQTRTIVLADRGTLRETLTEVVLDRSFGYHIDQITGLLAPLVTGIDGQWTFTPAGTGVEVTWQWVVTPTRIGALAMPAFGAMWAGYARQALEEAEQALLA